MWKISRPVYSYRNFGSRVMDPFLKQPPSSDPAQLESTVQQIYEWAKKNGAQYYSFLAFPHSNKVAEKQETFMQLEYLKQNGVNYLTKDRLFFANLRKGEGDGSSFPNGGLRDTSTARGYFLWDWKSQLFVKQSNKVLYIPSLLVNFKGEALDDKTTFRKAESLIQSKCKELLSLLEIENKGIFIGAGLEQEFFIISKSDYLKRLDLQQVGRALIGKNPPHHQQFSDHYYGKLEPIIEKMLEEAEDQLVQMGVPVKTRHKQVALNQYEFCSLYEDASRALDHNIMTMEVMKEACDRYGLVPLWHEKPFSNMNGSGKHINWSLNYFNRDGKLRNLFSPESNTDELFLLFVALKLKAISANQQLYLSSVSVPGNELRLGGHEAPPRIISAFLGANVTNMLKKLPESSTVNLKQIISSLVADTHQDDTDRNRTSPYAYTSNRFEFRAVGSSQNCYFPMTVILTTISKEIESVISQLKQKKTVKDITDQLIKQTESIVFNGNGYSSKWEKQARQKNLYVNVHFVENIENIKKHGSILVETGVYKQSELDSKAIICKEIYISTVLKEIETMLIILNKKIIPRIYSHLQTFPNLTTSETLLRRKRKLDNYLQKIAMEVEELETKIKNTESVSLAEAQSLRSRLIHIGRLVDDASSHLPESPDWPELYNILGKI